MSAKSRFLLCAAAAVLCGFICVARHDAVPSLPLRQIPPLDLFVPTTSASFSEVQNAKALLTADCVRFIASLRSDLVANRTATKDPATETRKAQNRPSATGSTESSSYDQALRKKIEEYRGTDQECILTQELLRALLRNELYDQWLEIYLDLLYRQPTRPLVALCADHAVCASVHTRRVEELRRAFAHLLNIPFEFEGKQNIEAALKDLNLAAPTQADRTGLRSQRNVGS
jgi:hypothetical protein